MYDLDGKASKRHQLLFHRFLDLRMRKQDLVRYMVLLVCAESLPKLSLHLVVMCLCRWARNLTVAICFDCLVSGVWSRVEFGRVCLAFSSLFGIRVSILFRHGLVKRCLHGRVRQGAETN